MTDDRFDVVILGTGIAGTILGAILARNGVRTLLVEQGSHPRFAIGESTVPETTFLFRVLAARYGVPEIANLSNFNRVRRSIATSCGVKRNFSFVFHRPDEAQRAHETAQIATLSPPMGPDVHLYRQDVDAYMLSVAASYGATVRQRTDVTDVSIRPDGVQLTTRQGAAFSSQYVVDAGGVKAPLAEMFGLRERPPSMRTHSRSIYTHLVGVAPFDTCLGSRKEHGLPSPLCQGTLHHLFDGGWMWVIPFYNHPSSTNRLCSVGLNLDPRRHPTTGLAPEEEFRTFVSKFPALAKQFERATTIREWVSTDRLQFSSSRAVGDRFCLMPHAFAFVDPLFSSGLAISMGAVNMMAWRLIQAKKDHDYSIDRFLPIDTRIKKNFDYFDRLVSDSYTAFSNFEVWNAWYKVWAMGGVFGAHGMLEVLGAYYRTGSASSFDLCEEVPYSGVQASELAQYMSLLGAASEEIDNFREGRASAEVTAQRIFRVIAESQLWPRPWGSAQRRNLGIFTVPRFIPLIAWMKREAPEALRTAYAVRFQFRDVLSMAASEWSSEFKYATTLVAALTRDFVRGYNHDWERLA
jgi:FADH2 O2-dependent halogenase